MKLRSPEASTHCACGTRLSRYNAETDECAACLSREYNRVIANAEASERRRQERVRRAYEIRLGITLDLIPYPSEDDQLEEEDVRLIVLYFARTNDFQLAADQAGVNEHEVRKCLRRRAAQEIIGFMCEEGTWPEGQSTGRWK